MGPDRSPLLSDRHKLPLLEAFILEVFRHSSFLPFTIPHWYGPSRRARTRPPVLSSHPLHALSASSTSKDTSLNGYFIPKDTCVFINQWQVNHDP